MQVVQIAYFVNDSNTEHFGLFVSIGKSKTRVRGVANLKCKSTHLWNRLNACEKGTNTNSVDPDETPQNELR